MAAARGWACAPAPPRATVDTALQAEVFSQNATVAGLQTQAKRAAGDRRGTGHAGPEQRHREPARQPAEPVLHAAERPEQPDATKPGRFGRRQPRADINALSNAYTAQRQTAQDNIVSRSRHAEYHAGHHRQPEQPDHRAEGRRPEHGGSGEPARRRGGDAVAARQREGTAAAERRPADHHDRGHRRCRYTARPTR